MSKVTTDDEKHPLNAYLRVDRLPLMWCPGCGAGLPARKGYY